MALYPLTTIWEDGDWGNVTKPVIEELQVWTRDREGTNSDKNLRRYMRFSRIVLLDPTGILAKFLGLKHDREDVGNYDEYLHVVRGSDYDDAMNIFKQMREIAAKVDVTGTYNALTIESVEPRRYRERFDVVFNVYAYKSGKQRPVP